MLLILIVFVLIFLILLLYFGKTFLLEKNVSQPVTNDLLTTVPKLTATENQGSVEEVILKTIKLEGTLRENEENSISLEDNSEENEVLKKRDEETDEPMEIVRELKNSSIPLRVATENLSKHLVKTPEGSPKSTSSCISSDILTDSVLDEENMSPTDHGSRERVFSISRPSSFPMEFSTSSSSAPYFNFTRKTPELIPRMMLEEFELLDRSIEKRKMDIRDLLRRIQSAKRRHRRFSEHIQRVQREHHINY
ncbi:hypothetical protein CAEBREN_24742 [Caenorhabditis brenneri]|uniref:Uncharacterized protein n=1 Tax=Caenorhabditis brenneri TaxID=135651 RepID=G0MR50_CAEBE|nr:hypothetical protein CAEBREN_24742 [Caenorhabditis brenneri]